LRHWEGAEPELLDLIGGPALQRVAGQGVQRFGLVVPVVDWVVGSVADRREVSHSGEEARHLLR
jgi:hypothetical protein